MNATVAQLNALKAAADAAGAALADGCHERGEFERLADAWAEAVDAWHDARKTATVATLSAIVDDAAAALMAGGSTRDEVRALVDAWVDAVKAYHAAREASK